MANTSYLDTNLKSSKVEYSHHCVVHKLLRLLLSRYEALKEDSPKNSVLLLWHSTEIITHSVIVVTVEILLKALGTLTAKQIDLWSSMSTTFLRNFSSTYRLQT